MRLKMFILFLPYISWPFGVYCRQLLKTAVGQHFSTSPFLIFLFSSFFLFSFSFPLFQYIAYFSSLGPTP